MQKKNSNIFDIFRTESSKDILINKNISKLINQATISDNCEKIKWPSSGYYDGSNFYECNSPEYPKNNKICKLTDILIADADETYFLSLKACAGIIARSEKRKNRMSPDLLNIIKNHMKNMEKNHAK